MLNITSPAHHCWDAISRRGFLQIGALGVLTLPDLLRARAAGAAAGQTRSDTAVIVVWLEGGPSHFETYDPKPAAPLEIRGPTKAIQTNVPGVLLCETLPRHAKVADKLALIRSCAHDDHGHESGTMTVLTGYRHPTSLNGSLLYPTIGSVVAKARAGKLRPLPTYVSIPKAGIRQSHDTGAAYLGVAFSPFGIDPRKGAANLELPRELNAGRLQNRKELLTTLDGLKRDVDASRVMEGMDSWNQQAFEMLTGKTARDAMDLSLESPRTLEMYTSSNDPYDYGRRCLLARRLVEAGVSFVIANLGGWDDQHDGLQNILKRSPAFDAAVAGLIEDIHQRGLERKVMVVVMGEFGRTPTVRPNGGRDHWSQAMSVLISGGGGKMGQVIGSTSARGDHPKDQPLHPNGVLATIYAHLGVDHQQTFADKSGRPVPVLPHAEPIRELL